MRTEDTDNVRDRVTLNNTFKNHKENMMVKTRPENEKRVSLEGQVKAQLIELLSGQ